MRASKHCWNCQESQSIPTHPDQAANPRLILGLTYATSKDITNTGDVGEYILEQAGDRCMNRGLLLHLNGFGFPAPDPLKAINNTPFRIPAAKDISQARIFGCHHGSNLAVKIFGQKNCSLTIIHGLA